MEYERVFGTWVSWLSLDFFDRLARDHHYFSVLHR